MNRICLSLATMLLISAAGETRSEPFFLQVPKQVAGADSARAAAIRRAEAHARAASGFEEQLRRDRLTSVPTGPYQAAKSRYEAIRESPGFQELVSRLLQEPDLEVVAR